jgi:hypothetical protein
VNPAGYRYFRAYESGVPGGDSLYLFLKDLFTKAVSNSFFLYPSFSLILVSNI